MTSPITPMMQSKIEHWRKSAELGTITLEELKEAIIALRGGRMAAAAASATAVRKKAITAVPTAEELMNELDGL